MTLAELQHLVLGLSERAFPGYWPDWDRDGATGPRLMAVQVAELVPENHSIDAPSVLRFMPQPELVALGFSLAATPESRAAWVYTIERTNEDGTPYRGKA